MFQDRSKVMWESIWKSGNQCPEHIQCMNQHFISMMNGSVPEDPIDNDVKDVPQPEYDKVWMTIACLKRNKA